MNCFAVLDSSVVTEFNTLKVEIDYAVFWCYSLEGGDYGAGLIMDYPDLNNQRFIANLGYEFSRFMTIELENNVIFPAAFLKENNLNSSIYHFVITTEIKF